jgi:putative peptide zinc metalloprotease protein
MSALLAARPAARADLRIGPAMIAGAELRHHLKVGDVDRYLDVGPKERFVIERLDGVATLAEIGAEYETAFGRRLDESRWQQILGVLASRGLLVGTESRLSPEPVEQGRTPLLRRLLRHRFVLFHPDRAFGAVAARARILFSRPVVLALVALVVVTQALMVLDLPRLGADLRAARGDAAVIAVGVPVIWLIVAIHEMAHGVTCKHFGGAAPEVGLMWRFPLFTPYCRTEDLQLFRRPAHRVYTAFAGTFAGLVTVAPFAVTWFLAEPGGFLARLSAVVLVGGAVGSWLNLVPFLQLDGYFMLNHALNMVDLRTASGRYLRERWRALRGTAPAVAYPRRLAAVYAGYGIGSLLFGTTLAVVMVVYWFDWLRGMLGSPAAVAIMGAVSVLGLVVTWLVARSARVQAPTPEARRV